MADVREDEDGEAHASLGASSCDRWWNCPGSVAASRGLSSQSVYAAEGKAAHALAESCLKDGIDPHDMVARFVKGFEVTEEMAEAVAVYVGLARSEASGVKLFDGESWIEQRVSLEALKPPAPMFGTADFVAYDPFGRLLTVVDYKHGAGYAVEAKGNPQLRYYGLGAALTFSHLRFDKVRIVVVQPRAHHRDGAIRTDEIETLDLLEWGLELLGRAKATLEPNAPLNPGRWCKFCPAAGACPALKAQALAEAKADFSPITGEIILPDSPAGLSLEEIGRLLDHADQIGDWLNAVRAFALATAEKGTPIPGYKLVPKTGRRGWKDEDAARSMLIDLIGLTADQITTSKLKTPTQVEKILGKSRKDDIGDLIRPGEDKGVQLVREESARPAVPHSAARDFQTIEG